MHDHDQPRLVAQALLDDRFDRRALEPEDLRHLGEHAGLVGHFQVQVERGGDVRHDLEVGDRLARDVLSRHHGDEVAEHRAGRLRAAGARPRHRDLGDGLGLDRHRVERSGHRGQRMAWIQEGRVHAHGQPAVHALGGAEQLQPQAQLARVLHVVGGDVLDSLVGDLVEVHRRVEGQPGQDRADVDAFAFGRRHAQDGQQRPASGVLVARGLLEHPVHVDVQDTWNHMMAVRVEGQHMVHRRQASADQQHILVRARQMLVRHPRFRAPGIVDETTRGNALRERHRRGGIRDPRDVRERKAGQGRADTRRPRSELAQR